MSRELHEWTGESKNRDFGGSRLSDRAAPSRVLYFGRFRDFGSLGVRARCSGHPVLSREKRFG